MFAQDSQMRNACEKKHVVKFKQSAIFLASKSGVTENVREPLT